MKAIGSVLVAAILMVSSFSHAANIVTEERLIDFTRDLIGKLEAIATLKDNKSRLAGDANHPGICQLINDYTEANEIMRSLIAPQAFESGSPADQAKYISLAKTHLALLMSSAIESNRLKDLVYALKHPVPAEGAPVRSIEVNVKSKSQTSANSVDMDLTIKPTEDGNLKLINLETGGVSIVRINSGMYSSILTGGKNLSNLVTILNNFLSKKNLGTFCE